MTETQKRIQELKIAIPHVKEKVVAVASLFAISVAMMASATYAWVTLSRNPELGGVSTTVSANGNLEIALSDYNGLAPDPSGTSDSFSAQGQTAHGANTSWGNLINLSGNYGLENLVLRPATLNTQSATLLSGVKYGEDGRVEGAATDFGFTTWAIADTTLNTKGFIVPDASNELYKNGLFGVRAISSVGYPDGKGALQQKMDVANELNQEAYNAYNTIMGNTSYIGVIQNVVQIYLDANISGFLNGGEEVDTAFEGDDVKALCGILEDFYNNAVCKYGETLAFLANMQQEFKTSNFTPYTMEKLLNASSSELSKNGVSLSNSLTIFRDVATKTYNDMITMQGYKAQVDESNTAIYWSQLEPIINNLINIGTVEVNGKTAGQITGGGVGGAWGFLQSLDKNNVPIVIKNGTLRQFEQLTGNRMNVSISFKLLGTVYKSKMRTNLTDTDSPKFKLDLAKTQQMSGSAVNKGRMVAHDTYGMVLDLWFRTNNPGTEGAPSILALDGLPLLTNTKEQRKVILVGETEPRLVYVYNRPTGAEMEGIQLTDEVLVYKDEDGFYYNISTMGRVYIAEVQTIDETDGQGNVISQHKVVVDTDVPLADKDVSPKMDTTTKVDGFASSNRVWKDNELVLDPGELSSTQGSGSCYVFYADNPEISANALQLLQHMKLAFIDANGLLLAEGKMDVEHVFSQNGKYTVPLVVENSTFTAVNDKGETVYGVSSLQQNVATRISVVVYLDGEGMENHMVMSNESIRGSLNLQFTTTEDLRSVKDSALSMETISLRAQIEKTDFEYTGNPHTPKLTAYVEGLSPNTVQAVFQRRINSSQGTQTTPVVLNPVSGDLWEGNCSFIKPGTYVLNSLLVDGVEYQLPQEQWITVTVSGFAVNGVTFCAAEGENLALTAEHSVSRDVAVSFGVDVDKQPTTVGVRFEYKKNSEDKEIKYFSTTLTRDDMGIWRGVMDFSASGIYTLRYLVLDNDYHELDPSMQKTFTAYLGLRTRVYLQREGGLTFFYAAGVTENVGIQAEIITDTNEPLMGRENVVLKYSKRGSSLVENGLSADLTWDGKYYTGTFPVDKPGVFSFAYLQAGNDTLTSVISAPSITCQTKEPPSLEGSDNSIANKGSSAGAQTMFLQNDTQGYYVASLKNAGTIDSVEVDFIDPLGNTVTQIIDEDIENYIVENETGTFVYVPIPTMASGTRNGTWKVSDVRLGGVFDSAGKYYGADKTVAGWAGDSYSVADGNLSYEITIYDKFEVKADSPQAFGKDATGKTTAEFMSAHSLVGYSATIAPAAIAPGKELSLPEGLHISNVVLTMTHRNGTNERDGGYTISGNSKNHPNGMQKYVMVQDANGKWVVHHALTGNMGADGEWGTGDDTWTDQGAAATLTLAGEYDYAISYDIVGDENFATESYAQTLTGTFKVFSKTPSVFISDISLDGQGAYAVDKITSGFLKDPHTTKKVDSGCLPDYKYTCTLHADHLIASEAQAQNCISRVEENRLTAWLYFKCNHELTQRGTYDGGTVNGVDSGPNKYKGHTYNYDNGNGVPRVDLTLDGMGQASNVVLTFSKSEGSVVMITQYTSKSGGYKGDFNTYGTDKFQWTAGGGAVCTRFIGVMENGAGEGNSDTKTVAGTITANRLVLTHNGIEYTVSIAPITIHNPY